MTGPIGSPGSTGSTGSQTGLPTLVEPGPTGDVARPGSPDEDRLARAALSRIAEPTMAGLGPAVAMWGAVGVLAAARGLAAAPPVDAGLLERLRKLNLEVSPERDLELAAALGARFVCPQDDEWPVTLAVLGIEEPLGLWVRGKPSLTEAFDRSVAVVGARAATAYGGHMASELGYGLAGRGWTVVSGGAFGIDALAHRGALAAGGMTVASLACGVDVAYPRNHDRLFARIAEDGLLISEWPPGSTPRPHRFLVRNRVIAAVTAGTVVVEGAVRSGALNTGRRAQKLGRALMVVPGQATSAMSAGCHVLLREEGTRLVTNVDEVIEEVGRIGDDLSPRPEGEVRDRDLLSAVVRGVLEAVPSLRPAGPAVLASRAGVDLTVLRRSVQQLIDAGFVEALAEGYRLSSAERQAVRDRRAAMLGEQVPLPVGDGPPELALVLVAESIGDDEEDEEDGEHREDGEHGEDEDEDEDEDYQHWLRSIAEDAEDGDAEDGDAEHGDAEDGDAEDGD